MEKREQGINKIYDLLEQFKQEQIKQTPEEIYNNAYKIASLTEFVSILENSFTSKADYIIKQFADDKITLYDFWSYYLKTELSIFNNEDAEIIFKNFINYIK